MVQTDILRILQVTASTDAFLKELLYTILLLVFNISLFTQQCIVHSCFLKFRSLSFTKKSLVTNNLFPSFLFSYLPYFLVSFRHQMDIPVAIFYDVLQQHSISKHEARIFDAKFQLMEEMVRIQSILFI